MMEPYLVRFRGRCSVSNILTVSGKRFEDPLPKLDEFPGEVCWLNSLALCTMPVWGQLLIHCRARAQRDTH